MIDVAASWYLSSAKTSTCRISADSAETTATFAFAQVGAELLVLGVFSLLCYGTGTAQNDNHDDL